MSPASDPPRPRTWLRLQKLEQMFAPTQQELWGAVDILGAPDDPTDGAGKSWCPAGTNAAAA